MNTSTEDTTSTSTRSLNKHTATEDINSNTERYNITYFLSILFDSWMRGTEREMEMEVDRAPIHKFKPQMPQPLEVRT